MPPSRNQNEGRKSKGRETSRPYTDTYIVGLRIGLSCEELRSISYPAILWLIYEYNRMNEVDGTESESSKEAGYRMATEADIRALMFM